MYKHRNTILIGDKPTKPAVPLKLWYPIILQGCEEGIQFIDIKTGEVWLESWQELANPGLLDRLSGEKCITIHSRNTTLLRFIQAISLKILNLPEIEYISIGQQKANHFREGTPLFATIRLKSHRGKIDISDTDTLLGSISIDTLVETFAPVLDSYALQVGIALVAFQEVYWQETGTNWKRTLAQTGIELFRKLLPVGRLQRFPQCIDTYFRKRVSLSPLWFLRDYTGEYWEFDKNAAYPDTYHSGIPGGIPTLLISHSIDDIYEYPFSWNYGKYHLKPQVPIPFRMKNPGFISSDFLSLCLREGGSFEPDFSFAWNHNLIPESWLQLLDNWKITGDKLQKSLSKGLGNVVHGKFCSSPKVSETRIALQQPEEKGWYKDDSHFLVGLSCKSDIPTQEEIEVAGSIGSVYWQRDITRFKPFHQIHIGALVIERHKTRMLELLYKLNQDMPINDLLIGILTDALFVKEDLSTWFESKGLLHPLKRGCFKLADSGVGRFTSKYQRIERTFRHISLPGIPINAQTGDGLKEFVEGKEGILQGQINRHNLIETDWTPKEMVFTIGKKEE